MTPLKRLHGRLDDPVKTPLMWCGTIWTIGQTGIAWIKMNYFYSCFPYKRLYQRCAVLGKLGVIYINGS